MRDKTKFFSFTCSNHSCANDEKTDWSALYEKSLVEMSRLSLFSKLKSSYIVSIAKTTSNKIVNLIRAIKFLSRYNFASAFSWNVFIILQMGLNYLKAAEPHKTDRLPLTTKSPGYSGTHSIDHGKMIS